MDDNKNLFVDFVMSPESEAQVEPAIAAGLTHLGKCSCGGDKFVLASELDSDTIKGIPASRMYECMDCGTYRLG